MPDIWRLRMSAHNDDFTEKSWADGQLGIWYGAWTADDLRNASSVDDLRSLPAQQALGWDGVLKDTYFNAAKRFAAIPSNAWVLVYLKRARSLGLAKLDTEVKSEPDHPLNLGGETLKYRMITEKKQFAIDELPDAYKLLASQGRSNVYRLNAMWQHAEMLARFGNEHDLFCHLNSLSDVDLLDFLGDTGWESFCMAYLVIEEHFVPTGLSAGRTLAVLDLVGRRISDGVHIYAQCKKSVGEIQVSQEFIDLANVALDAQLFYFAYGGATDLPDQTRLFTRTDAIAWVATTQGKKYLSLLRQR